MYKYFKICSSYAEYRIHVRRYHMQFLDPISTRTVSAKWQFLIISFLIKRHLIVLSPVTA